MESLKKYYGKVQCSQENPMVSLKDVMELLEAKKTITYPELPKIVTGFVGKEYNFSSYGGYKTKSQEYGKGYIQAIRDVKRLNKNVLDNK
jgi:hypothetical protein